MEISIRYPIDHRVLFKALPCIKIENKTLYMAMLFSYFLGLRATEVVSLSWNDLNIERKTVTYSNKKNGRIVKLIPKKLIKELIIWIELKIFTSLLRKNG
jgi:integrase